MSATALFREPTAVELELTRCRDELSRLRATLITRERDLSDLRGQLFSFEGRYIRQVGKLYQQLDEWEERIAELHSRDRISADFAATEDNQKEQAPCTASSVAPNLKALFRELAKCIHPDLATDALDEQRRTRLMAQANDAFQREDRHALQRMLNGFEVSTQNTGAHGIEAELARVMHDMKLVEQDIFAVEQEVKSLTTSELAKLQERTMQEAQNGRDLLAEMAARVKGRIGLTMRQYELNLDRIRRPSTAAPVESLVTAETYREPRFNSKRGVWVK